MGQLTLIQPSFGDQSEKLQNSPKLVLQRCLQKCVPIWWRLIEMAGIPWYIAPLKGCIFHKTLGCKGCWLSVCSSAIHLNWFDSSTKESEFLECMVDLISRQFFTCSSKIDHRQNVFLSLILYFPFTFMTKRFFLSLMFFFFFFSEIDLCASHPCENTGTCKNFRTYYTCSCPPGFQGVNCETGKEIKWTDNKCWDKTFVTRVIVYDLEVKFYKCCEQKMCHAYCYRVDFDSESSEVLWIEK